MPAQPIYLLKLFMRNGQFFVYAFTDAGRAVAARDVCAKALNASREAPKPPRTAANPGAEPWVAPAICRFVDDARREAIWDGADMSGVQMVELFEDIEMTTRVEILARRHATELLTMAGELPQQQSPQNGPTHPAYVDSAVRDAGSQPPERTSIARFAT